MTTWNDFAASAPQLAAFGQERFDRTGLVLVGTIRRDGFPRISPVEPIITGGELYLGMMFRSTKALDLLRDPRCVVHSVVGGKDGSDGEFKLYGRARSIEEEDDLERYGAALYGKTGWRPESDFNLFAIAVEQAASVLFDDGKQVIHVWRPGTGVREVIRTP